MIFSKTKVNTAPEKITEILERGVEDVFVREELERKLKSGKKLRVKLGIDPTSPHIHIGRAVVLRKLKAFQDLGHQVVFIVGDFTAQIGDPSDKLEKRPMLTKEKIKENLKSYKEQVGKIINLSKAEFHYNSSWLSKLSFREILNLQECFSLSQMIERRNFKERFERGDEISMRETSYPLMQGYDSVAVRADIEIGGFDQLFNLKAGRIIQKAYNMPEQDVLTCQMLEGTDGRKMSSSWGNVIAIDDTPDDMYGKIMSLRDELIPKYFLLTTSESERNIQEIEEKIKQGENPKNFKMRLAREIVELYYGREAAEKAEQNFSTAFSKGGIPDGVQEIKAESGAFLKDILAENNIVSSKSEFTRLVEQGAIQNMTTGESLSDMKTTVASTAVWRIGKKIFVKILV